MTPGAHSTALSPHDPSVGTHATRAGSPAAIRFQGVTKTYGSGTNAVRALRGIDLDVASSQLVMLVGPSGCGKTTLVSILSGVLDADAGKAEVFGVDWRTLRADQQAKRRAEMVGFVFQSFNLIPTLNVLENTCVPLLVRGFSDKLVKERASAMLSEVGLGNRLKDLPSQLSGGQQQRVAIARALVGKPRLLVCDEPTAALDGKTGQTVMELIRSASRGVDESGEPRVVVVVTHDNRIFHYADHIVEMEDGKLKETVSKHIIEDAHYIPTFEEDGEDKQPRTEAPRS